MLESIPLSLFHEWIDYAALNPFGEDRADLRFATVAAEVHNTAWKPKKTPLDYMPKFGDEEAKRPQQTDVQMEQVFLSFMKCQNAAVAAKKRPEQPKK